MTARPGRLLRRTLVIAVVLVERRAPHQRALELFFRYRESVEAIETLQAEMPAARPPRFSSLSLTSSGRCAQRLRGATSCRRTHRGVPLRADQAPQDVTRHHRGGRRGQGGSRAPPSLTDAADSPGGPGGPEPRCRLPGRRHREELSRTRVFRPRVRAIHDGGGAHGTARRGDCRRADRRGQSDLCPGCRPGHHGGEGRLRLCRLAAGDLIAHPTSASSSRSGTCAISARSRRAGRRAASSRLTEPHRSANPARVRADSRPRLGRGGRASPPRGLRAPLRLDPAHLHPRPGRPRHGGPGQPAHRSSSRPARQHCVEGRLGSGVGTSSTGSR